MPTPTDLYKLYETDPNQEVKGIGLKFGDAEFYVRRAGGANEAYDTCMEEKTRSVQNRLQLAAMTKQQSDDIMIQVYAETVVIGWKNVRDRSGEIMEFTKENFIRLMKDLPTLWNAIRQQAQNHENFLMAQAKQEGEALGNS